MTPDEVERAHQLLAERNEVLGSLRHEKEPGHWWQFRRTVRVEWAVGHSYYTYDFATNGITHRHLRAALDGALAEIEIELKTLGVNLNK